MSVPAANALLALLAPERLTCVVDVGANPIDGDPPYKALLDKGVCQVVGFEPQPAALARLNASKSMHETYLPYAIGPGGRRTLNLCLAEGMTSLFEPDAHTLGHFPGFAEWGRVVGQMEVDTRPLSAVAEITALDFLKMDLQGGELDVIETAGALLDEAVCVQAEVSFIPLYKDQPTFGEVDLALRKRGFVPHMLAAVNRRMILPMRGADVSAALNQVVEADAVYVRSFLKPEAMSAEQLKHLAIIAHYAYRSYDLAVNCVHHLAVRGAVAPDAPNRYFDVVRSGG